MSLRQKLLERLKVAGCAHQQTQLRNLPKVSATAPQVVSYERFPKQLQKVASLEPSYTAVATFVYPRAELWPRLEAIANKCNNQWLNSQEQRTGMPTFLRTMNLRWQQYSTDHLNAAMANPNKEPA